MLLLPWHHVRIATLMHRVTILPMDISVQHCGNVAACQPNCISAMSPSSVSAALQSLVYWTLHCAQKLLIMLYATFLVTVCNIATTLPQHCCYNDIMWALQHCCSSVTILPIDISVQHCGNVAACQPSYALAMSPANVDDMKVQHCLNVAAVWIVYLG